MTPVVFAIPRSELGGAQRSLVLLLRALDRKSFPPRVFLGEDGPLARALAKLDVPCEIGGGFKSPRTIARFLRFAKGVPVLHLFGARTIAVAARSAGMRVVERVNLLRSEEAGGLVRNATLDRVLLKLADAVVVPARVMEEQLRARGVPAEKLRLIPNGVFLEPPSAPREELRARLGVHGFVILGVGRLARVKGFDLLAEAVPGALIAGEGPERSALEKARLLGDRDDVADLLSAADVFVLPSRSEVLSNALLEAMLAGKACVATDVGGTREVLTDGETGLLVPPEDPGALRAAIERLRGDPALRERLGQSAREHISRTRSLERMARAHEALYRELAP